MTKSATPIPEDALTLKMEEKNWNLGAIGSGSSWPRLSLSLCHVVTLSYCPFFPLSHCAIVLLSLCPCVPLSLSQFIRFIQFIQSPLLTA